MFVNVKFEVSSYASMYTYRIPDYIDPADLTEGTLVIAPVAGGCHLGFSIAKVVSVNSTHAKKATKFIVDILDTRRYRAELVRQAKVQELENRLKDRYNQLQKNSWLDELKARDPEAINMIRELENLK